MKALKRIIIFFMYYIFGYLIFNLFVLITQLLIYIILKLNLSLVDSYISLIKNNIQVYTIIYMCILSFYLIYNFILVKVLNKKLERIKKVGEKNEK